MTFDFFNDVALDAESISRMDDLVEMREFDPVDRGGLSLRNRAFKHGVEQCGLNRYFKHSVDYNFEIRDSMRSGYGMSILNGDDLFLSENQCISKIDQEDSRKAHAKYSKYLSDIMKLD